MSNTATKDLSDHELVRIENEIKSLEQGFQAMEDTDYAYMSEAVKRLRHYTFYIHQKVEEFIGRVQTVDLIMSQSKLLKQDDAVRIYLAMEEIFNAADFGRLLKLAEAKKLLPYGFQGIAGRINEVRLAFAHPRSYIDRLRQLKDPQQRLLVYKDLKAAMDLINKHIAEKQKERDALENKIADEVMMRVVKRIKIEGLKNSRKIFEEEMER